MHPSEITLLTLHTDPVHWRCKECVSNGLEEEAEDHQDDETAAARRRSSAPKIARDLLPAARGGIKPGSHSVFNTLILDDDPMDGSRALRKRKSPSNGVEDQIHRKRRRTSALSDTDRATRERSRGNFEDEEAIETGDELQGSESASQARSSRPRRTLKAQQMARIISATKEEPKSLVVGIPISTASLDTIERNSQKKQRRRERDRARRAMNNLPASVVQEEPPAHYPSIATTMYTNPFYAFPDRETDDLKGKPYGGVLTDAEADTSRTYPQQADREVFEAARRKAEEDWIKKTEAMTIETPGRARSSGPPSKIKCINFGGHEIDTWHAAPYPEEYSRNKVLYICEFCLKYMNSDFVAWRHKVCQSLSDALGIVLTDSAQMPFAAPSRRRDLPQHDHQPRDETAHHLVLLRGRWKTQLSLLPESVSISEAFPGLKDTLLRRRTIPFLRHDGER